MEPKHEDPSMQDRPWTSILSFTSKQRRRTAADGRQHAKLPARPTQTKSHQFRGVTNVKMPCNQKNHCLVSLFVFFDATLMGFVKQSNQVQHARNPPVFRLGPPPSSFLASASFFSLQFTQSSAEFEAFFAGEECFAGRTKSTRAKPPPKNLRFPPSRALTALAAASGRKMGRFSGSCSCKTCRRWAATAPKGV